MDPIERALEPLIDDHVQFREEHKALLTSQILLTDKVDKLADELKALAQQTKERFAETDKRFAETDERLNALIHVVDGLVRRPHHKGRVLL